ncbi:MAG: hypothetical protein ACR2H4_06710 [Pyrinomonadaceae bacterium]
MKQHTAMRRFLIPIVIGILLTMLLALLAGFAGGACHCETPAVLFFPYDSVVRRALSSDLIASFLFFVQYPVYALLLANLRNGPRKAIVIAILLILHVSLALFGLMAYSL